VDAGWLARVLAGGEVVLEASEGKMVLRLSAVGDRSSADPVLLEIFNNLFASIAEQMGVTLQKTACSTNVKERLDFSCAIFDPQGNLVVNAPHIPVHLGAMSETVKRIITDNPEVASAECRVPSAEQSLLPTPH